MSTICYLLDENVDPVFRMELLRQEPALVVWKIGDPGILPKGTLDPDILCWCEANGCILVTNNRKSIPQHVTDHLAQGRRMPGIIELNPNMSIGETVKDLVLIWGASNVSEYQDLIIYLPLS